MTFGQCLKQLMEDNEISQTKLSKELSIAVSTLNGYANDYREPDFLTLIKIAQYFHVTTDYLLGVSSTLSLPSITFDADANHLFYLYQQLSPEMKNLLIEQARLLCAFDTNKIKNK